MLFALLGRRSIFRVQDRLGRDLYSFVPSLAQAVKSRIVFRILLITFILLSNRIPQKGQKKGPLYLEYHFQLNYQSYSN